MRWASALSKEEKTLQAIEEAIAAIRDQLHGEPPSLLFAFASPHHADQFADIPKAASAAFPTARLVGCSGGGVIGAGQEIEEDPALSLTAAVLPGVLVSTFHLKDEDWRGAKDRSSWQGLLGLEPSAEDPCLVLLPDPFSCEAESMVRMLDAHWPAAKKIGGLASGAHQPNGNALFLGAKTHRRGLVGVALSGRLAVDTLIAQGCRPVGQAALITRSEGNLLLELNGRPPAEVLRETYEALPERDQHLFRRSLFIGIEMRDQREYHAGDFLIRNVIGIEANTGGLLIGAPLEQFKAVQFHVRDAASSAEDLARLLDRYRAEKHGALAGALLFSCVGRGAGLYGRPDHDSEALRRSLGEVPLGGFFCNGEIGPIGGATFLHGYTSAFGLFTEKKAP